MPVSGQVEYLVSRLFRRDGELRMHTLAEVQAGESARADKKNGPHKAGRRQEQTPPNHLPPIDTATLAVSFLYWAGR